MNKSRLVKNCEKITNKNWFYNFTILLFEIDLMIELFRKKSHKRQYFRLFETFLNLYTI